MKKVLAVVLAILCFLVSGCAKSHETEPSLPAEVTEDVNTEDDGALRSTYIPLSFSVPSGWVLEDRMEIASTIGANEEYATADPEEILSNHVVYVEFSVRDDKGDSLQLMIENPPIQMRDGSTVDTASEYQTHNYAYLPVLMRGMGIDVPEEKRDTVQVCGYKFERASFLLQHNGNNQWQQMMSVDVDGYICTIFITCGEKEQADDLLTRFSAEGS